MSKTSKQYGYNSVFPTRFRELLKGHTQKEIAELCGVKPQSVSLWLNGSTRPDILYLAKIAEFFNVSTDYLLGLSDIKTTDNETKALCLSLGLSENAVGVLLCSEEHIKAVIKKHKTFARKFPSFEYSKEKVMAEAISYSVMLREGLNRLAADFIKAMPVSMEAPQDHQRLSFIELFENFYDYLGISQIYGHDYTCETSPGREEIKFPLVELSIEGTTKDTKPFQRFDNIKKLLIEAAINDIVAKLHDIKNKALTADNNKGEGKK